MNTQISTTTFERGKHYSGVYQQQGRMLRDADWNELVDVLKGRLSTALENVVGSGVPATGGLFSTRGPRAGRAYVDGIEAELTVTPPAGGGAPDPYADQADFPAPPPLPSEYVLYLDVWERVVSALDDPGLLDVALHGADTCARSQVLTQLKWCPPPAAGQPPVCEDPGLNPPCGDAAMSTSKRAGAGTSSADPCDPCADTINITASSGNYLFRLEVHSVTGPPNKPTNLVLKWSSENGAEQHPVASVPADFAGTAYIYEAFDDVTERQLGVHLATGFTPAPGTLTTAVPTAGTFVRRWDGVLALAFDGAGAASLDTPAGIPASADGGVPLTLAGALSSHGDVTLGNPPGGQLGMALQALQVTLDLSGKTFVAGDYWLAVVRDNLADPVVPDPQPYGIRHHYLTLGQTAGDAAFTVAGSAQEFAFPTLTDLSAGDVGYSNPGCASGIFSSATNVQQALDAVCELKASQVSYSPSPNTTTATATDVQKALDLLSTLNASEIPYDPGTCAILQGATSVGQALSLLCQNASQGNSFNFALVRLFGRGVICGLIPSITVAAPAADSTDVPIEITVTDGTFIDGNGEVVAATGITPLQLTVPALAVQGLVLPPGPPDPLGNAIKQALAERQLAGVVSDDQVNSLARLVGNKTFATTTDLRRAVTGATGLTNPDVLSAITSGLGSIGRFTVTVATEVKEWLYIVTTAGQPPGLQLTANAPTSLMTLPSDVSDAIRNPAGGPTIPAGANCATASTDAWAAYSDEPCVTTNGNTSVCLGTVGVFGESGWVSPDDREQIAVPSVVAAYWRSQRQSTYAAQKAACIASELTVASLHLGGPSGPALDNQSLLGGTSGRTLYVALSDIVRGSTPVAIAFLSSGGVTVRGPLTIQPGQSGGTVTFDIADAAGPQSITAQLDASHQHPSSFTSVQMQAPTAQTPALTAAAAGDALMPGDVVTLGVTLTDAVTEALTAVVTGDGLPTVNVSIPQGSRSGSAQAVFAGITSFTLQATALGATRTAPITVVAMQSMNLPTGQNLNGAVLTPGPTQAVVTLSGPCPRPIEIAVSTPAGSPLQLPEPQVSVAAGATTSQPFQIVPIILLFNNPTTQVTATFQLQQVTATVTISGFGFGTVPTGTISPINPILGGPNPPSDPGPINRPPSAPQ